MTEDDRIELYEFFKSITTQSISKSENIRFFNDFYMLLGEIENGGFHQYLSNATGDSFTSLYEQMQKLGFEDISKQFRKVLEILKIESMSENRVDRNDLLSCFGDDQYELFDEVDMFFQDNSDEIEERFYLFYKNNLA